MSRRDHKSDLLGRADTTGILFESSSCFAQWKLGDLDCHVQIGRLLIRNFRSTIIKYAFLLLVLDHHYQVIGRAANLTANRGIRQE